MGNLFSQDNKYLPIVKEKLEQIREMYVEERYEAVIDMIAPIQLSDVERLKLRARLEREYGFPVEDFDLVFGSKTYESRRIH